MDLFSFRLLSSDLLVVFTLLFHFSYSPLLVYLIFCNCSAGIGVLKAARRTMARTLGNNEDAFESARSQFWVVDVNVSIFITYLGAVCFLKNTS